jgi:hypothetical protein
VQTVESDVKAGRTLVTIGTQLILCGLFIPLAQCLLWLREGHWTPCTLAAVLHWTGAWGLAMSLVGAAQITDWVLAIPLCAWPVAAGFTIAWIGATNADNAAKMLGSGR